MKKFYLIAALMVMPLMGWAQGGGHHPHHGEPEAPLHDMPAPDIKTPVVQGELMVSYDDTRGHELGFFRGVDLGVSFRLSNSVRLGLGAQLAMIDYNFDCLLPVYASMRITRPMRHSLAVYLTFNAGLDLAYTDLYGKLGFGIERVLGNNRTALFAEMSGRFYFLDGPYLWCPVSLGIRF